MIIIHFIAFCFLYIWEVIRSTAQLAKLILSPDLNYNPRFLEVPLEIRGEFPRFFFACLVSMTPGTLSVSLKDSEGTLLVHWLDCDDPDTAIAELKYQIERPLLKIFNRKIS